MKKSQNLLNKIIIVAMFSALCCAATFVQIRMPAGDFVHLGNFVMIISALLLGGLTGGIVGSVGMGLYDLLFYINKPSTIIRTIILKFLIGFLVGFIFNLIVKKKKDTKYLFLIISLLFGFIFISSIILFALGNKDLLSASNGFSSTFIKGNVKLGISIYIPIFTGLFLVASILSIIFGNKLSTRQKAVLFAVMLAIFVNILGEFFLRWLLEGIMVSDFKTSIIVATSKIPGSVITGSLSVILSVLIYEPVYKALKNTDLIEVEDEE